MRFTHKSLDVAAYIATLTVSVILHGNARADTYCQTNPGLYSYSGPEPKDNNTTDIAHCFSKTFESQLIRLPSGGTHVETANALAEANVENGTIRLSTSSGRYVRTTDAGILTDDGAPTAVVSLEDWIYIPTERPGQATLTVFLDGNIGYEGDLSVNLSVVGEFGTPGGGFDTISYLDPAVFRNFRFPTVQLSPGSSFDSNAGKLTMLLPLAAGFNAWEVRLNGSATGNVQFDHTVGLQLSTPDGVAFSSKSGKFLTQPLPSISGGVTFGDAGPTVPEPSSWALMIAGFGAVGATLRRRRASLAAA